MAERWQFWIDRGGTFTDCLGQSPRGDLRVTKILSADRAPLDGIRMLLGVAKDAPIPPCDVRMGTTLATNALLERRGARTVLVITRGFGDVLRIGNQTRPDLFALDIAEPQGLYERVIETDARAAPDGSVEMAVDGAQLGEALRDARGAGMTSVAVVVLHAYVNPSLEQEIAAIARDAGFADVTTSAEIASEIGLVGRGDTTVVDAYLTPLLRDYVATLRRELPGSGLHIMQSSGALALAEHFRGKNAVLSGPAGGVVALGWVAARAGEGRAIGFDMGGTSTDVSCWDGRPDRVYETEVAGVRLRAPMMDIHTVAAGGGSVCRFQGFRLTVGPESAGADPGPLCYGNPAATELTVTDLNLLAGRIAGDRFPFPLDLEAPRRALEALCSQLAEAGHRSTPDEVIAGLLAITNASMATAIREVTVSRGRDARDFALVVFGGAGGQHACSVADRLGIESLIFDDHAGVLSALGMGLADVAWHGQSDAGRMPLSAETLERCEPRWVELEEHGQSVLREDGLDRDDMDNLREIDLRYAGTESALTLPAAEEAQLRAAFESEHRRRFGYVRVDAAIEVVTIRSTTRALGATSIHRAEAAPGAGSPARTQRMWTGGHFEDVPVWHREDLPRGDVDGPCLVLRNTDTIAVDRGWMLSARDSALLLRRRGEVKRRPSSDRRQDPVRLEIFGNLFMSIAAQMGHALQRTAVSTNIRDRLDFSCAIFDARGGLVANAPHIPVHLGAMSESIKGLLAAHPDPAPGTVYATNDPSAGGSHLPDITVISPVHDSSGVLRFFTASRGHHADIGGTRPGSMPPDSQRLSDEGVVLSAHLLVDKGRFLEHELRAALAAGPWPARNPDHNVADLQAQIAANRAGANLLTDLAERYGLEVVLAYMAHVQDNAAAEVGAAIAALPDGVHRFRGSMDDGTAIEVAVTVAGDRMIIDFAGTSSQHPGNLNAPRAVTVAAVIYVLRTLVGTPIPLNSGCLAHVDIRIPAGSLLDPAPDAAVVAGNVETSQRVVDVLLAALGLAAASQGTMNNLTFGTERFGYYETIAGGAGATPRRHGASAVHTHMTNTRITDAEILEARYPVRVRELSIRRGSGGPGRHRGGDGVIRELELLEPMDVSILSERRNIPPFGLAGGGPAALGRNLIDGQDLGGRVQRRVPAGARIRIETPGGGGFGAPESGD